jgi:hypothetical protein
MTEGVLKIIFWFVGSAESTATRTENTQGVGEDFETHWLLFKTARVTLTWPDDREVLEAAQKAFERGSSSATRA